MAAPAGALLPGSFLQKLKELEDRGGEGTVLQESEKRRSSVVLQNVGVMIWKQRWRRPLMVGDGRMGRRQVLREANVRGAKSCRRYKVWEQGRPWRVRPVAKGADFGSYRFTSHKPTGDRNRLIPELRADWECHGSPCCRIGDHRASLDVTQKA